MLLTFSNGLVLCTALAYAIKMNYKRQRSSKNLLILQSIPLEGLWGKEQAGELIKEELIYTIMIGQPDFITGEMVKRLWNKSVSKDPNPL